MTDRHDEDQTREHPAARPPAEGVRIIGAEEAQAVLEGGAAGRPISESDEPERAEPTVDLFAATAPPAATPSASPEPPEAADEPTAEHVGLLDEVAARRAEMGATDVHEDVESESDELAAPPSPEGLPHWSEPATGEVPIIRVGDGDGESSEGFSSPRFRTGSADWSDEEEFEAFQALAAIDDDEDETPQPVRAGERAPTAADDDREFDREVAARRVRPVGAAATRPAAPRRTPTRPEPAPTAGPAKPDMLVRVVTGLGMAAIALLCLWLGRAPTMVLATVIVTLATFELMTALHTRGFRPAVMIALLGAVTIVPLAYERGEFAFPFVFAILTVFTLLWFLLEVSHARPTVNVAVTIGGFMYTAGLGAFAGLLLVYQDGVGLVLGVAIPVIAYDVIGYFVGSQFGKSRLAPHISPNKTVEGLIGGMAGAIIVSVLVVKQITPWGSLGHAFLLGVTVAVMAPLGDLAESMLKRDLGIKDFGAILPGHGGVLDRFDAILFCLPAVYFLARALGIG